MRGALLAMLAVAGASLLVAADGSPRGVKEGGTFKIAADGWATIDPALASDDLTGTACGTLLTGLPPRPDLAEAEPTVSRDGKTYTFTIRKDTRFSNGQPVTARAFARAIERILDPAMQSGAADFQDILGAKKLMAGKTATLPGAVAKGRTLTLRLVKRQPVLPAYITGLCAVPPNLPVDPEGAKAPLPSAGPYYVAEFVRDERLRLERNRFYKGTRSHHVDRFVADLDVDQGSIVDAIASGNYDSGTVNASSGADRMAELARRYGINKGQYWIKPGLGLRLFYLNTSGRLFRNNPKLRQAVNFAIDRRALTRELGTYGGRATDQYLMPVMPGFRDERIYPLKGPNLKRARSLATGHLRSGKAVLYTPNRTLPLATAEIVKRNLAAIGLEVEIRQFPPDVAFDRMTKPGEPFDIGYIGIFGHLVRDPSFLSFLFDGRTIGQEGTGNRSHFDSPEYNRLLEEASRLPGDARYRAYAKLDVRLSRDAAPAIPWAALNDIEFVSARVGCVTFNPLFDLTAICLK